MDGKVINYIKSELKNLADFGVGEWFASVDSDLGRGIYEYNDSALGLNLRLYERGVSYSRDESDFTFSYSELSSVEGFLTLPEVARLNGEKLVDEMVSFKVVGDGFNEKIKIPFKVYVCLAPLITYLVKLAEEVDMD